MKKFVLAAIAVVVASSMMFGQLKKGGMAITTAVSPGGAIGGAYALSENMRINAGVNFSSSSTSGTSSTNFGVGGGVWLYQPVMENVTTFYGGQVTFGSSSVAGTSSTSIGLAGVYGAEYWFSSRFGWAGYVQAGFSSSGPSGATTSTFGTLGVGTELTWWFN